MSRNTKQRVLFVDDETTWRDRVSASLTGAGFNILAVPDGSEAMRRAEDPALGLIIVDHDLAGESGVMLARFLRWNHPDIPTMVYTSPCHKVDRASPVTSRSACEYLPKGSMEDLISCVGYYLISQGAGVFDRGRPPITAVLEGVGRR